MKKSTIVAIFIIIAVVGVGVIISFSRVKPASPKIESNPVNNTGLCANVNQKGLDLEKNNQASEIGEGEIRLTCDNFQKEVEEYQGIVMVDMYSPTCPHCQKMGPVVSEIALANQGKYKIGKLNVYAYPMLASRYGITSVPAFLFFKNGKEVERLIGEQAKEKLQSILDALAK